MSANQEYRRATEPLYEVAILDPEAPHKVPSTSKEVWLPLAEARAAVTNPAIPTKLTKLVMRTEGSIMHVNEEELELITTPPEATAEADQVS